MKTSEILIYSTIIFLLYKVYKNTQSTTDKTKRMLKPVIDLPKFSLITPTYWDKKQLQPTPEEVLTPDQLAYFKAKNKGISKQIYTC